MHRLDLEYIRIRKLLIDCSKKGILLFTVMSCLMYVMLHVTSHIMYEHDRMTDETCHMTDVTFHMTLDDMTL